MEGFCPRRFSDMSEVPMEIWETCVNINYFIITAL